MPAMNTVLPLLVLPPTAFLLRSRLPSWGFMWAMACALYAGCKWLTYRRARTPGAVDGLRALGYLLAWPGMDSTAFLRRAEDIRRPDVSEWISAALKTLLGATLLLGHRPHGITDQHASGWLGRHGRCDSRLALRHVSFAVTHLAERRRECRARHAESVALELVGGILGTTVEHGVS